MNQKQAVLKYLHDFGSITAMEAFSDLGITKLATVVSLLRRKDGVKFDIRMVETINRYGHSVRYAKYSLAEEKKND